MGPPSTPTTTPRSAYPSGQRSSSATCYSTAVRPFCSRFSRGCLEVLETVVRPLGARATIAGHGPVSGPELVDDVLVCLHFVQDLERRAREARLSPLEAARDIDLVSTPNSTTSSASSAICTARTRSSAGPERGAPLDAVEILTEMVAATAAGASHGCTSCPHRGGCDQPKRQPGTCGLVARRRVKTSQTASRLPGGTGRVIG